MTLNDISLIRLFSQQVEVSKSTTVRELVGHMGAIQAQDFAMAKWALGKRVPNSTDHLIERSIDNAELIRTHLMRPTWHLVAQNSMEIFFQSWSCHAERFHLVVRVVCG